MCRMAEEKGSSLGGGRLRGSQHKAEKWLRQVPPAVRAMKTVLSVEKATRCQNGVVLVSMGHRLHLRSGQEQSRGQGQTLWSRQP